MSSFDSLFSGTNSFRYDLKILYSLPGVDNDKVTTYEDIIANLLLRSISSKARRDNVENLLNSINIKLTSKKKGKRILNNYIKSFLINAHKYEHNKNKFKEYVLKNDEFQNNLYDKEVSDEEFDNYLQDKALEMLIIEISRKEYLSIELHYQNVTVFKLKQSLHKFYRSLPEQLKFLAGSIAINLICEKIIELISKLKSNINKNNCLAVS